jgi:hypothetical protein
MSPTGEDARISYRQVGTASSNPGTVRKGSPQKVVARESSRVPRSVSSIPSKFETTLHVGTQESNGFGGRTHRFFDPDNDRPGPGAYHKKPTLERDASTCGSVSKLGMGTGFVSKVKRFDTVKQIEGTLRPGPGSYDFQKAYSKKDYNKAKYTSNFMPPRHFRDEPVGELKPTPFSLYCTTASRRLYAFLYVENLLLLFRPPPTPLVVVPVNANPGPGDYMAKDQAEQKYSRNNRYVLSGMETQLSL